MKYCSECGQPVEQRVPEGDNLQAVSDSVAEVRENVQTFRTEVADKKANAADVVVDRLTAARLQMLDMYGHPAAYAEKESEPAEEPSPPAKPSPVG